MTSPAGVSESSKNVVILSYVCTSRHNCVQQKIPTPALKSCTTIGAMLSQAHLSSGRVLGPVVQETC